MASVLSSLLLDIDVDTYYYPNLNMYYYYPNPIPKLFSFYGNSSFLNFLLNVF